MLFTKENIVSREEFVCILLWLFYDSIYSMIILILYNFSLIILYTDIKVITKNIMIIE